ncbi:alpha/beta hydrolase domain-containing protein [Acrasis kona]|uniref:Alpha/beta hydrolase domain-containing protein n=1 Tax=Acrasis kona TaxID=1008807 RepID=A0AAW2ZH98_9EUKA
MGNIVSSYVFMPPMTSYDENKPMAITWLETKTKKSIPSYFLPSKKQGVKTTVLYSHGNAADIGLMYDFLVLLRDYLGVNIFHYEYIGYGLAREDGRGPLTPNESTTYESAEAAMNYLLESKSIPRSEIIIHSQNRFGTSVGSGPSCHLASKYTGLKGLILECPFTSIIRVVSPTIFARPIDIFCNINKIDKVTFPVLVIHGRDDDVVPFDHGVALHAKIPEQHRYPPTWIDNGTHHNIIERLSHKGYILLLRNFIKHCTQQQQPPTTPSSPAVSPAPYPDEDM